MTDCSPVADRTAFLEKLSAAVARAKAHPVALHPEATHAASYVGGGDDPVATLLSEWIAVGGKGDRVRGADAAREWIVRYLQNCGAARVLRWAHPLLERLGIDLLIEQSGASVCTWSQLESRSTDERWEAAFAAELGITSVNWAVAETGSLAMYSRPGQGRVTSLLPPHYLAIVEPSQIVPDLYDFFDRLEVEKSDLPTNVVLVTGPSKTGDIELKLTTGVHGPGDVTLLVVEDL